MPSVNSYLPAGVGGGDYRVVSYATGQISAGAAGDMLTITPQADQKVVLSVLHENSGYAASAQIVINGTAVTGIVRGPDSAAILREMGVHHAGGPYMAVYGRKGDVVKVVKPSGSLSGDIRYTYLILE